MSHALRAVRQRSTVFVTDLFNRKEGHTASKLIRRCTSSEYRVWLKCMTGPTGTYPVQVYLRCIGKAQSPICLHCSEGTPECLTHFACVCPKIREARTSAHNQVRAVVTSFLSSTLGSECLLAQIGCCWTEMSIRNCLACFAHFRHNNIFSIPEGCATLKLVTVSLTTAAHMAA